MSFLLSFINCGDGFPWDTLIVEWIDIEPSVAVTHSKDMSVFLVQAEEAGTVVEVDVLML